VFPTFGLMELLILVAIILLLFGAKRLPQLGRSLGSGIREFRKGVVEADDKDEAQDREKKSREELSHGGAPDGELPRAEDGEPTRTERTP
jgi:sec-independent protein translocase protein TatA